MLRLQKALPDTYTTSRPEELVERIRAAKETLGSRVFILGHHYQRDEVMEWADARGDSFGLSRIAADQTEAEYVVFCAMAGAQCSARRRPGGGLARRHRR